MAKTNIPITPRLDYVLIEPQEEETKTASGIVIPDTVSKEKPQKGTILAVGPGTKDEPMTLEVAQVVMYKKWGGTEIKLEGKEYLLVKQEDILAIYS